MNPIAIFIIGVTLVIAMIIVLRLNAFIALITAAIVVSLLSPGDFADKITRVAGAFGSVVGSIGIVIALAAIIGKCLMESGAADRIVRSFLKALGEKRAPTALMGSGFVLSIPVFFDTVFYLLVPLARSLWTRTRKNYVLYITAIAAGAAITHTLVPPTPGPLFMADQFNVDLGLMIGVGVLVGVPTAVLGLLVCKLINRLMDIPMRPYAGELEAQPLDDSQLPALWLSLLPVVLPVILISANTITKTMANAEHAALLRAGDVQNFSTFAADLAADPGQTPSAAPRLMKQLPDEVRQSIRDADAGSLSTESQAQVMAALNDLLGDPALHKTDVFEGMTMPEEAEKMLAKGFGRASGAEVEHFNRLLLDKAFAGQIKPHVWNTPRRKAAVIAAVLGNPNLALLLSAAIAMFVLVRNRGVSLKELSQKIDTALMSGGVIILITAGGGAFGAMLRAAGIQDSVKAFIDTPGQGGLGLTILLVAFAVAAVMKFAQGSGTVSMITTASMFAAMGISSQMIGCNLVYLAMAIGSGSLVGDWMNNSGFWIFAKMGGLTEIETLKSWTIITAMLGFIAFGFTLLLAHLLPMMPV